MKNALMVLGLTLSFSAHGAGTSTMNTANISNAEKAGHIGVGLQAGSNTGVNAEYWAAQNRAWTAAISQEHGNAAVLFGHNWMYRDVFAGSASAITPYIGAGLLGVFGNNDDYLNRTETNRDFVLAAQMPLGLEWLPHTQRFSIFGQISPSIEVTPLLLGFMGADIGARFYF